MWLVHCVGVLITQLLYDTLDRLIFLGDHVFTDGLLESYTSYHSQLGLGVSKRLDYDLLESTSFSLFIELIVEKTCNMRIHDWLL